MTSHSGWTEFTNYTVSLSAVRGTAVFSASTSSGVSPANVTTAAASSITYTITGAGGNVTGCFLCTGSGAVSTQSSTAGTLYSAGAFGTAKAVTAGDTVSVTYSTTATLNFKYSIICFEVYFIRGAQIFTSADSCFEGEGF